MLRLFIALLFLLSGFTFSQVGINTTTPQSQLDITASNTSSPSNTDGILIPRISAFPITNPTAAQNGMLVYLTTTSAGKLPGFYYWDNTITNWKSIGGSQGWGLSGNSGTVSGNYIGTSDLADLKFKVNGVLAAYLSPTYRNTIFGYEAGGNSGGLPAGNDNVAIGTRSLASATNAVSNIAIGGRTISNSTSAYNNIAIGSDSMINFTNGHNNVSIGGYSMQSLTFGENNVSIGTSSGNNITTGSYNISIGRNAAVFSPTANYQMSIGNVLYGSTMSATNLGRIGIGEPTPNAKLQINASDQSTPTNTDGVIIPKIDTFPSTNPTAAQQAMLVYLTTTSAGKQPGFYYWNNATTSWIGINSTINGDTDWLKYPGGTIPNNSDDIIHGGKVIIGSIPYTGKSLNVTSSGIYNQVAGQSEGIYNYVDGSVGGNVFANYTRLYGNGSGGAQVGNYIKIESTNNVAEHDGVWVDMTNVNTTGNNRNGMRVDISGTANSGNHIGLSNNIQSNFSSFGRKYGVQNSMGGTGENYGIHNSFSSGSFGYGFYNSFMVSGLGLFNQFSATTSATQYGIFNNYNSASTGTNYGIFNNFQAGSGTEYGLFNDIQNNTNSIKYGTYNRFTSTGTSAKYGTYNDFSGNIAFPLYGNYTNVNTANSTQAIYGNYFNMTVTGNSSTLRTANFNSISGSGTGTVSGMYNSISYSGTGYKVGVENSFSGNSTSGSTSGFRNTFNGEATDFYGYYNFFNTTGTATQYGLLNASNGTNSGAQYGVYNNFNNAASGVVTGIHNVIDRNSSSILYGVNNDLRPNGSGNSYGIHTQFAGSGTGNWYSNYTDITNGGAGSKYGFYALIRTSSGGQHYGIYSEALKSGAFAGYFLGNVSIGTTSTNNYILPISRGTTGQTMQIDGSGNVNWTDPSLRNYATTGVSTGIYNVSLSEYTVRVYNGISEIRLPTATGNQGKIFIVIGSNGISTKIFSTAGGFIYDDVTNTTISTINPNERYTVQSDGTDWIVIGR